MLEQTFATTEFLALDTETNGLSGDRCELTEVGTVLVGGGELHDEWTSLVGVANPLGRGIQRFTGISQAMVDAAPAPEEVLPRLATLMRGRVLVAHNAAFDVRVLRQAFARAALEWPAPPVICTVSMARRFAPLQRRRGLATLAAALGVEVDEVHRALPDARTCARVFCALFGRLAANAPTVADALAVLRPRKVRTRPAKVKRARGDRPHLAALPHEPGVYIFRDADGRPLYVGKSVDLRTRARSHFTVGATWAAEAEHVDHQVTESELGALLLEDRLIKALRPPGNVRGKPSRTATSTCAAGWTSRSRSSRSRASPPPATPSASDRCAGARPRPSWSSSSTRCSGCATAGARSRAASTRPPTGRWAAACRRACTTWTRTSTASGWTRRCSCSSAATAAGRCSSAWTSRPRRPRPSSRYERAAWLQRRRDRLEALLDRLGGVLRATHTGARLVLAPHPEAAGRFDAIWIAGGRVVDWGTAQRVPRQPRRTRPRWRRAPRAPSRMRPRRASSAAGCPRRRSRRRGWSAPGSPPTSLPSSNSGPGRGRRHTPLSSPGWGCGRSACYGCVVDSVNVNFFAYVPVRSGSPTGIVCLKSTVATSVNTGVV